MSSRKLLGALLLEVGLLTSGQLEQALARQQETGLKLGQVLVDLGWITEDQLVEMLSRQLQIAVAPVARLRQVRPPAQALEMVPAEMALTHRILPIFYNPHEKSLSLVMADPQDLAALSVLKQRNQLERLRVLIAGERLLDELLAQYYGSGEPRGTDRAASERCPASSLEADTPVAPGRPPLLLLEPDDAIARALVGYLEAEGYQAVRLRDPGSLERARLRAPDSPVMVRQGLDTPIIQEALAQVPPDRVRRLPAIRDVLEDAPPARFTAFYLQVLDFFTGILEADRDAPARRHLQEAARLSRSVAQRLELSERESDALTEAVYLRLLGPFLARRGMLEPNGSDQEHTVQLASLWEGFGPPLPVVALLRGLKADGSAVRAPLGSLILHTVTTYLELRDGSSRFDRNGHDGALRYLKDRREAGFDARVVDALQELLAGEFLLNQLEAAEGDGRDVVVVDRDPEAIRQLERPFMRAGYRVRVARTGEEALDLVRNRHPLVVISAVTLPRMDGLELFSALKADPELKEIPVILVVDGQDDEQLARWLELDLEDLVIRPVLPALLVSKTRRIERDRAARLATQPPGLKGSLADIGLFDLLQVLQMGMRTVHVVTARADQRCDLYLEKGALVYAAQGTLRGPEAFFELCTWDSGTFSVIAEQAAPERNVNERNDFLLMEGMRRADELIAGLSRGKRR